MCTWWTLRLQMNKVSRGLKFHELKILIFDVIYNLSDANVFHFFSEMEDI